MFYLWVSFKITIDWSLSLWVLGLKRGLGHEDNLMRIISACHAFLTRKEIAALIDWGKFFWRAQLIISDIGNFQ